MPRPPRLRNLADTHSLSHVVSLNSLSPLLRGRGGTKPKSGVRKLDVSIVEKQRDRVEETLGEAKRD